MRKRSPDLRLIFKSTCATITDRLTPLLSMIERFKWLTRGFWHMSLKWRKNWCPKQDSNLHLPTYWYALTSMWGDVGSNLAWEMKFFFHFRDVCWKPLGSYLHLSVIVSKAFLAQIISGLPLLSFNNKQTVTAELLVKLSRWSHIPLLQ